VIDIDPPPVGVGQVVTLEPLYDRTGRLRAVAVVDPETDAIVQVVPPESVTFAAADSGTKSAASPEIS
jgi:hypothetical protein